MTKYVIRSMSTTNLNEGCVPYHVYLMRTENRNAAYWSSYLNTMFFDSIEAAETEWLLHWPADEKGTMDIAPVNHTIPVWKEFYHRPAKVDELQE